MCSCHLFLISFLLLGPYTFCPLLCSSLHEVKSITFLLTVWKGKKVRLTVVISHLSLIWEELRVIWLLRWCNGKESVCQCRRLKRYGFDSWVRKMLWHRKWQPAPVFLPGNFHGQRILESHSPWDRKESDMTVDWADARVRTHTHTHTCVVCVH